jgi:magnesium-transporting ATPase (P-type)
MILQTPTEDPDQTGLARRRFKRLMIWMALATTVTVVVMMAVLYAQMGLVSIHFYIATALGVTFAMMLMAVLMGLAFLSNTSGHDDVIRRPQDEEGGESR